MKRINLPIPLCTVLLLVAAGGLGGVGPTLAQVEPRADEILRAMGAYLASAEEFRFHAEISCDTFSAKGQELLYGGRADVFVRRPDRLRVEYDGDERRNRVVYDGERIVLYHAGKNLYAATESDAGIDDAVDRVFEESGFSVPIADLVSADPYEVVASAVGATVPYLPDEAKEESLGGKTYFVYADIWYKPFVSDGDTIYMVVEDPREA